jgi:Flp pilus assembly protein TadD
MNPTKSRTQNSWSLILGPWSLLFAIVLAYANTLHAPFLFDDAGAVVNNPTIRDLWSLAAFNPPADGSTTTGRPLVNFSFALNYALSGDRVWSYHATNLALHALAALTLFGLVRRTPVPSPLERGARQGEVCLSATLLAFTIALLWSLHPLQTETVVCTAQRTESLCALFYLVTLYAFVRGVDQKREIRQQVSGSGHPSPVSCFLSPGSWLVLSIASCLAGMASKEVMVTAPLLVLLYDRTFVAGTFAAALRARRAYYAALAGTWLLLAWLLLRGGGARGVAAGFGLGVSPWHYLLTQCDALVLYLRLTFWPYPLALDYGPALVGSLAEVWWQALIVLALLGLTIWALFRRPRSGFLGAGFFILLAPSSSFVPLVTQTIAEHRMYLPLAALLVALALAAHRWLGPRATLVPFVLSVPFLALTFARNRDYSSTLAIWQDNVAHRPHARALTALGVALLHAGRAAESLPHFERALALDPSHLSAQRNRALALLQLGRAAEAAVILTALPGREPGEAAEFFALGNAFAREQKFAEAAAAFSRTVALEPAHFAARANLGNCLFATGRPREAIAHYEEVLRLRPDDARTRENLQLARASLR